MDHLTRCELLNFALLNHLDPCAARLGLQRLPQAPRVEGPRNRDPSPTELKGLP
jgi:hypothetical protein